MNPESDHGSHLLLLLLCGSRISRSPHVDGMDRLAEVTILNAAAGTGDHLGIVGEEVEALVGVDYKLVATVALKLKTNIYLCFDRF